VIESYGPPRIETFEDALTASGVFYRQKPRLLTLFGSSKGELNWGLNNYSDGSGIHEKAIPCTSYNEAVAVASEMFAAHEAAALDHEDRTSPARTWSDTANEYGIPMSEAYIQAIETQEAASRRAKIKKLRSQLETLENAEVSREPKS